MQVTETQSEGLRHGYKVVVPASDLDQKLDVKLESLRRNVTMPGFRPGKVPTSLLKKIHRKNLMGEILEQALEESSRQVLSDHELRPATQPKFDDVKFEEGSDLEYSMSVEVMPDFTIAELSGITLERLVAPATAADVEAFLERLAAQQRSFEANDKAGYKAQSGDAVLIDYEGRIDGTPFDGGTGSDFQLELGSGHFIPGFEEQLIGATAGEAREVTVTFPEDYPSKEICGKEATFACTVREVRNPLPVTVDDELAKRVGLETLEALKTSVREQIEKDYHQVSRLKLKRSLLDHLADSYDFPVPLGMRDMEFDLIWNEFLKDLERNNASLDELGKTEDEAKAEYQAIAERRVRLGLLLSEIGRLNSIEVRQDEVNRLIADEARKYPGQEKQVFEFYRGNPTAAGQLRAPLLEEKVVDYILELATLEDRQVDRDELMREPDEEDIVAKPKSKKKAPAKKITAKKTAPKKAPAKKAPEKKAAVKKAAARKTPAKKAPAKKTPAKKAPAKKASAGKSGK